MNGTQTREQILSESLALRSELFALIGKFKDLQSVVWRDLRGDEVVDLFGDLDETACALASTHERFSASYVIREACQVEA
jgi:hypothetical protein